MRKETYNAMRDRLGTAEAEIERLRAFGEENRNLHTALDHEREKREVYKNKIEHLTEEVKCIKALRNDRNAWMAEVKRLAEIEDAANTAVANAIKRSAGHSHVFCYHVSVEDMHNLRNALKVTP